MYEPFTCGGCGREVATIARQVGPITVGVCCHSQASYLWKDPGFSVVEGVVRWESNGRVPPADSLAMMVRLGMVTAAQAAASGPAREAETAAFIGQYVAMRAKNGYSDEERSEMAAAFGPGEVVVDVFTGQRIAV